MLSYRHGFHAGNHADVLKHFVLVELLLHLKAKDKPFWYVDTHAGAGMYALDEGFAAQQQEWKSGIGRLITAELPPAGLATYLGLVRRVNAHGDLRRYPGSPWFAREMTRPGDRLWLCEMHPADHQALAAQVQRGDKRVRVINGDGFAELKSLLPPQPRRSLVMIDPSYELPADYAAVLDAIRDSLARFPSGVYAIWYPMLSSRHAQALPGRFRQAGASRWLDVRMTVRGRTAAPHGLYGSGVFVVNPPYTLPSVLQKVLPSLVALLAQDDAAAFELDFHMP